MALTRTPLAGQAYEHLLDEILSGRRKAGERLSEESIVKDFGISRTPAREALMRLAADGVIERTARKGCRIKRIDHDEQRDVFICRAELEVLALTLGIANISDKDLDAVESILDKAIGDASGECALAADEALHILIARASGNKTLARFLDDALRMTKAYRALRQATKDSAAAASERRLIIGAIRRRNLAEATRLLREHIMQGLP
ncbi:MAG: GntR family transcriptional regulator [Spirochaetes bacterium]|nr:GntR family transcriptional regulator [Spirochaetota bacterium]